jgi:hypothetical protein
VKALARRLNRLEVHVANADRPRRCLRIRVTVAGCGLILEGATCTRMFCADGSVLETLRYSGCKRGTRDVTAEDEDRWVSTFPIQNLRN